MNKEEANDQLLKALSELEKLHPKKIDLGLSRIDRVLKKLGNPHKKLPTTIHVAGTNGKGSTVAYLKAFSEAQGKKVHVYTSPHLVNFNERIVIASEKISDEYLVNILNRITIINDNQPLSFFEATTAAALLAFSEIKADLCIIEVGLGGRYDATNVIIPDYCAITPIDLDHSEFLGNDIAKIAKEKGGIIKKGIPVVVGPQSEITRSVLENEAYKNKSHIKFWGTNFKAHRERGRLIFENNSQLMDLPLPALHGDHQVINAGT
ncbi:Mur ligase family protein, partial [Hellea sp.]|nr:Mur ligase family protein [Hellea sp.]